MTSQEEINKMIDKRLLELGVIKKPCCLNCEKYDAGFCSQFKQNVPDEFVNKACDSFLQKIPF